MNKSRTKSLQNLQIVRTDVCDGVAAWRDCGRKTPSALDDLAAQKVASRRRVQSLFFNEKPAAVRNTERTSIRLGIVSALRRIADELEAKAAYWRHVADLKEAAEQQTLFGEEIWQQLRAESERPGLAA